MQLNSAISSTLNSPGPNAKCSIARMSQYIIKIGSLHISFQKYICKLWDWADEQNSDNYQAFDKQLKMATFQENPFMLLIPDLDSLFDQGLGLNDIFKRTLSSHALFSNHFRNSLLTSFKIIRAFGSIHFIALVNFLQSTVKEICNTSL